MKLSGTSDSHFAPLLIAARKLTIMRGKKKRIVVIKHFTFLRREADEGHEDIQ